MNENNQQNNQQPEPGSEQHTDKISDILEKIHKNELKLRPKTYFRLKYVALVVVGLAIFFTSIFLSSFIVFSFRASGHESLIGFGPSGWQLFLVLFPWNLLAVEIILIVLLEWFLRSFRFGYKIPVLYLLFGVLVLMLGTGFIVAETPLHDDLLHQADERHLPGMFDSFYENVRRPPPEAYGLFKGTIMSIKGNLLVAALDNQDGLGTTTPVVVILPNVPGIANSITVGDRIFILGSLVKGKILANGIRIAHDMRPPSENDLDGQGQQPVPPPVPPDGQPSIQQNQPVQSN